MLYRFIVIVLIAIVIQIQNLYNKVYFRLIKHCEEPFTIFKIDGHGNIRLASSLKENVHEYIFHVRATDKGFESKFSITKVKVIKYPITIR